jgi:hypothetical protein
MLTGEPFVRALSARWKLDRQEEAELRVLAAGGVNEADYVFAVDKWRAARTVGTDWGYLRTTMLCHRAEKLVVMEDARREASAAGAGS